MATKELTIHAQIDDFMDVMRESGGDLSDEGRNRLGWLMVRGFYHPKELHLQELKSISFTRRRGSKTTDGDAILLVAKGINRAGESVISFTGGPDAAWCMLQFSMDSITRSVDWKVDDGEPKRKRTIADVIAEGKLNPDNGSSD